jgi:hypothetical protein
VPSSHVRERNPNSLSDYQGFDDQAQEPNNHINQIWKKGLIGVLDDSSQPKQIYTLTPYQL